MQPHPAASVILLREPGGPAGTAAPIEVCMVRRRRGSSFMASAYVFPGGGVDAGETDRECAARELFEEAGVALVTRADGTAASVSHAELGALRRQLAEGRPARAVLDEAGLRWDVDALTPWAHWITPSVEPKRFSAQFFVAALPAGQVASADEVEAVELAWVGAQDALTRAGELSLPPPQLRTLWELAGARSVAEVLRAAQRRSAAPHPILPRAGSSGGALCLLLPWDPEYQSSGNGEAHPMPHPPSWATGPSRFVLETSPEERGPRVWKHLHAPGSTTAG